MRIVPFLILIALILAIDAYSFQALRTLVSDWSVRSRRWAAVAFWAVTAYMFVATALTALIGVGNVPRGLMVYTSATFFILYLAKVIVIGVLFGEDLVRGATWGVRRLTGGSGHLPERRKVVSALAVAVAGVPFAALVHGMVRNAYRYQFHDVRVPIRDLPSAFEGFRIVQLSDIHAGSFTQTEPVAEAVDRINALDADLIVFTGDLVNELASEMDDFIEVFGRLRARHGVLSITGNHDYGDYHYGRDPSPAKTANFERFKQVHAEMGWDLLMDEHRTVARDGARMAVLGVQNWSEKRFGRRGDLDAAHADTEDHDLRILLSHDPTHWDAQVRPNHPDIALTLSGHTHGAQFGVEHEWLRWSPAQFIYDQWAGLYTQGRQHIYVNRGFGFLGYPGRVGILPEVAVLELVGA